MSWKPSRSSGIVFDKHTAKAKEYRAEIIRMIESREYLHFSNLMKLSRLVYHYWQHENKAHNALCGRTGSKRMDRFSLHTCCVHEQVYQIFKNYPEKLYKPIVEHLK